VRDRKIGRKGGPPAQQSAKTGNIIAGATAAVPVFVVAAGEAAFWTPILVREGITYGYFVLPATPVGAWAINKFLMWTYRFGVPGPVGSSSMFIQFECGKSPGACPGIMTPK